MPKRTRARSVATAVTAVAVVLSGLLGACSGDDDARRGTSSALEGASTSTTPTSAPSTTASPAPAEKIQVLVTNDDGVKAPGIDAIVSALAVRDDVEVTVVAPAENQSGQGGKTTPGALSATDSTTASGHPAKAVAGTPADSVVWALGEGGMTPDLVISGINSGQNIGPVIPLSGTVGAARQAAQKGIPAVAASQGLAEPPDFATGVKAVLAWFDQNRAKVADGSLGAEQVANINIPSCPAGSVRGPVEVPAAGDTGADLNAVDCAGAAAPTDDVTGFTNGWITISELPPTGSKTS